MSIEIRKGTEADISDALQLVKELALYEKAPNEVEVTPGEMLEWGFGADKQFDFFVAIENGVTLGLALYYYKYSTWKGKCLFLEDIIVTESQRGRGLGKLLFDKVVQVSKEQNVRRMEWQVLDWNTPAIEFYKKYNATLDGEWVNCKLTDHELEKM
jgi:GNAT superfamily N-acetyltransferase